MKTLATFIEATCYDPVTTSTKTVRFCNRNDPRVTTWNNLEWRPLLIKSPSVGLSVFNGDFTGFGLTTVDNFVIAATDKDLDSIMAYMWHGARIKVYAGDVEAGTFPLIFSAVGDGATRKSNESITVGLRTNDKLLEDRDVLYYGYAGSGDIEGTPDLEGVLKPMCFGDAKYCRPVLIDEVRQIYQVHGYGPVESIYGCFEGGLEIGTGGAPAATYTGAYAEIRDAVVVQGEWVRNNNLGLIKLGSQPSFPVTVHCKGDTNGVNGGTCLKKAADIIKRVVTMTISGVTLSNSSMSALNTAAGYPLDIYYESQVKVLECVSAVLRSIGAYWFWDVNDVMTFGRMRFGASSMTLSAKGDRLPDVINTNNLPVASPTWSLRIGAEACHFVHDASNIPSILLDLQAQLDAFDATINTIWPPSTTPPAGAIAGDLWPDTSTGTTVLRRYDGGSWIAVTDIGFGVKLSPIGSTLLTDIYGNSFKRTNVGSNYNYAVVGSLPLSGSAYVRCLTSATGKTVVGLDDLSLTSTSLASQAWLFEVTVSTGAWVLYKDGASVASGSVGAIPVDTNFELKYTGKAIVPIIGTAILTSVAEEAFKLFYPKIWAYQAGTVTNIAAGYANIDSDPFATVGDNYAVDPNFKKAGFPDYTLTSFSASSSLPAGAPDTTGVVCTAATGTILAKPNGARFPAAPNQLISVGAFINLVKTSGTATPDLTIQAKFYSSAGALLSTSPSYTEAFASATSGWLLRDHIVITPANTASVECIISFADKSGFSAYVTGFRIGRTQAAADQTMWVEGTPQQTVQYDSAGNALAGELPKDLLYKLKTLLGTVTGGVSWAYVVQEGGANLFTVSSGSKPMVGTSTGTFSLASLETAYSTIVITASYGGLARDSFVLKAEKFINAATSGGGGGGSGGTMPITKSSGFSPFSSNTFTDLTGVMSGTMPSAKTSALIAGTIYATPTKSTANIGDSWTNQLKAQRNTGTVGSPIWTDKGSVRSDVSSIEDSSGGEPDVPPFKMAVPSAHAMNETDSPLTGGGIYDWRIVGRISSGTNLTNVHNITGSVTVSAP